MTEAAAIVSVVDDDPSVGEALQPGNDPKLKIGR
jgi:hypothetical protein